MHYQAEQEARATAADARADDEQQIIAEGIAILTLQNLVADWGIDFVQRELQRIVEATTKPLCDRCHNWSHPHQICWLRAEAELEQLPKTHAAHCAFWQDLGF